MDLVSVIIPCFNVERYIETALQSVFKQTYPRIEVIAVDDGSTDKTQARLTQYSQHITVLAQTNQGACSARNRGAARTKGSHLIFLDADDYLSNNTVEVLLKAVHKTRDRVMACCNWHRVYQKEDHIQVHPACPGNGTTEKRFSHGLAVGLVCTSGRYHVAQSSF